LSGPRVSAWSARFGRPAEAPRFGGDRNSGLIGPLLIPATRPTTRVVHERGFTSTVIADRDLREAFLREALANTGSIRGRLFGHGGAPGIPLDTETRAYLENIRAMAGSFGCVELTPILSEMAALMAVERAEWDLDAIDARAAAVESWLVSELRW